MGNHWFIDIGDVSSHACMRAVPFVGWVFDLVEWSGMAGLGFVEWAGLVGNEGNVIPGAEVIMMIGLLW